MKWSEAIERSAKASITNRDASGLVGFARAIVRTYGKEPNVSLSPWDWYAFALPALGWAKPGDKFKIDTKHQLLGYAFARELIDSLKRMATELDASGVPFRAVVDPRGTDKGFRQLAADAWQAMKQLGAEASNLPDMMRAQWTAQLGPVVASAIASSASSAAAAAAKPPAGSVPEPEQLPLPGVPQVMPPPGGTPEAEAPTYEAQPVGDETKKGGGGLFLLAAAFMFGSSKKKGKRWRSQRRG
jgi:hypothetical protein